MFIPVFKIGAAIGRIVGEAMHLYFPLGIPYSGRTSQIIPGNVIKTAEKNLTIYRNILNAINLLSCQL